MEISGSCFCGELKYEAVVNPEMVGICHCRDCQILSGSAFRTAALISGENFRFTSGQPNIFEKVADSGGIRRMAFCGLCGTHICSYPEEERVSSFVSLRITTAREYDQLPPRIEVFCSSKVPWLPPLGGMIAFDHMPTG